MCNALDDVLKISFRFQSTRCALRCPGYDTLLFFSIMSVECTNPNHKSAQSAQLGQPAPKFWIWICTFHRHK